MVTKEVAEAVGGLKNLVPTGTSVLVEGELSATPEGTKQVQAPVAFACVSECVCMLVRACMHTCVWSNQASYTAAR